MLTIHVASLEKYTQLTYSKQEETAENCNLVCWIFFIDLLTPNWLIEESQLTTIEPPFFPVVSTDVADNR